MTPTQAIALCLSRGQPTRYEDKETIELRRVFEAQAHDSYGFKRSRKGTYVNPAVARDWKWFRAGVEAANAQR